MIGIALFGGELFCVVVFFSLTPFQKLIEGKVIIICHLFSVAAEKAIRHVSLAIKYESGKQRILQLSWYGEGVFLLGIFFHKYLVAERTQTNFMAILKKSPIK